MTNKKLGIGIVHCLTKRETTGYNRVFTSDDGQWSSLIDDTGEVFRYIRPLSSDVIIRMVKIVRNGWYMCSMKPTGGRGEEYRASWVYFPVTLRIEAKDIENIIHDVEWEIMQNDYNSTKLQTVILNYNTYISEQAPSYNVSNFQQGWAIRFVDGEHETLYDIYSKIYQRDFAKFAWVLLVPESSVEIKNPDRIKDITSKSLVNSHTITLSKNDWRIGHFA